MDTWTLIDTDGLKIGVVQCFRYESWRVSGRFMPDLGYSRYQRLFADLEYAANEQLFTHVDDLERSIAALRIRAVGPSGEDDPQRVAQVGFVGAIGQKRLGEGNARERERRYLARNISAERGKLLENTAQHGLDRGKDIFLRDEAHLHI